MNTKPQDAAAVIDEEPEDVFGAAFDTANAGVMPGAAVGSTADGDKSAEEAKADDKVVEGDKPAEEVKADDKVVEGEKLADDKPADKSAPVADATDKLLDRLEKIVTEKTVNTPAEKAAATEPEPELYTAEEKEILAAHQKDWPEVAKAEALARRGEYNFLATYIFKQVGAVLEPFREQLEALADRAQHQEITAEEPDYEVVRDEVIAWVGKQPSYLQTAYKSVMQSGTPDEVVDLIKRFKSDTGVAAKPASAAEKTETKEPELSPATKQAAAALAPVSSKRSEIVTGVDQNDFSAAFEAFSVKTPN